MRKAAFMLVLLFAYVSILVPFTSFMRNKPVVEKLGFVPAAGFLKPVSADQKQLVAAWLVTKAVVYFGGLAQHTKEQVYIPPEYFGMYKTIETALKLDPYNMDGYYFAQAILAWDVRRIHEANQLLEYGMKYRDWDFYLPYFAGFNYAFFLKDYARAAEYYKRVGDLTGDAMILRLTGRYLYEAGRMDMAIAYLSSMEKSARNEAMKKTFRVRLQAFKEVKHIEEARDRYREATKRMPASIQELVRARYLEKTPIDPYGGTFYFDNRGKVRTTSKFVFGAHSQ